MRDIKFRAWDKTIESFIYSDMIAGGMWRYFKTLEDRGIRHFESEQWTGMEDRNGKDIYERDIVKSPEWDNAQIVKYEDIEASDDMTAPGMGYQFNSEPQNMEVIGNIHENPELVKRWRLK